MEEIWKDIKGYCGIYQVSNMGNVRSFFINKRLNVEAKILKPSVSNLGYCKVDLYKQEKSKTLYVHRLVAIAFLPNPEGKKQVNHKDGDKQNNRVDNLEWATSKENLAHAVNTGLRKKDPNRGNTAEKNTCSKKIIQIDKNGKITKEWVGIAEAARNIGCNPSSISLCLTGKHKSCKGYVWKYAKT